MSDTTILHIIVGFLGGSICTTVILCRVFFAVAHETKPQSTDGKGAKKEASHE